MRLTWPMVLAVLVTALVVGSLGYWAGSIGDDTWRGMRDHPRNASVCLMANQVGALASMPPVDCSGLP